MKSPESVAFLVFVFLCVLGAFHSYYTFPIEENLPEEGESPFEITKLLFTF